VQGGSPGSHGLAKVRENRQAAHHRVVCFTGPGQHLIFKFLLVKLRLAFLFSSVVNVI